MVHITILVDWMVSLGGCPFALQCLFFSAPCRNARVTKRLIRWPCCDILVVFVHKARQDILVYIMIHPPSLGDISSDKNLVIIVNTSFIRILLLPKLDDERMLHLLKLSGSTWKF